MSVCIVGNGKSILSHEYGSKIDSFDTVIRINTFKIEGFEKHVGTKTDIFATSAWSHLVHNKHIDLTDEIWLTRPMNKKLIPPWWIGVMRGTIKKYNLGINQEVSADTWKQLKKNLGQKLSSNYAPSSGIVAMLMAIDNFQDDISVVGFDFFKKPHYYPKKEEDVRWHEMKKEKEYFETLLQSCIIRKLKP